MKLYFLAIIAVLAVTMCVTPGQPVPQQPAPDIGVNAPTVPQQPTVTLPEYCGLYARLISPSPNERLSGGFRIEWTLSNEGSGDFTNNEVNFTIYMKSENGDTTDLRTLKRFYGETYKEDLTFLKPVAKGKYVVGVRGKISGCTLHEGEVNVTV